jgi:hypothetical protein
MNENVIYLLDLQDFSWSLANVGECRRTTLSTSPRREASLFDLPGSSEPGLFFWGSGVTGESTLTQCAARSREYYHSGGAVVAMSRQPR